MKCNVEKEKGDSALKYVQNINYSIMKLRKLESELRAKVSNYTSQWVGNNFQIFFQYMKNYIEIWTVKLNFN